LAHDTRLYTTQILIALASSPLPWSGTNAFSIIGYSLGGGISTSFTSTFPTLVASLVIIAPSGILRESHIAWQSKILYSTEGILPGSLIQWLVKRRLSDGSPTPTKEHDSDATDAVAAETGNAHTELLKKAYAPLFPHRPTVTVGAAVQWQIQKHAGFLPAFVSAIRHAPITAQHPYWRKIGERLTTQKLNSADEQAMNNGLWRSKVLMILGSTDPVIIKKEVEEDAEECFGKGNLETVVIEGGHEIPMSEAKEVTKAILRFWGEDAEAVDFIPEAEVETGT
jgi:pimeloyl-ACP methyl ester carboxylesterase